MKKFNLSLTVAVLISLLLTGVASPTVALAATTPSLGTAGTYGILSSTFTRNIGVTTITGDLGYTTLGGSGSHTVSGSTFITPPAQSGIDQGAALSALAAQACTFTFAPGAIDLATDTTHGALGVYTPGVYCTGAASAASIGTAGITLSGSGTFIFRVTGALTSVDNSNVLLADGASSCDVFWTPTSATTLGANTTFKGIVIDDSGITVGNSTTWMGRALAFGGTVTTDTDTINSTCSVAAVAAAPVVRKFGTINVVKTVINDNGRTKLASDFVLFVNGMLVTSGATNSFIAPAAAYTVSETADVNYKQSFSGDCDIFGKIGLNPGDNKFCIITNNDIGAPVVIPPVPPLIDVVKVPTPLALPAGPGVVSYDYTVRNIGTVPVTDLTMVGDTCSPIRLVSGDINNNAKLDMTETWVHRCATTLTETHTNTVVATGWANGISAVDIASATVVVGIPVVPPLIHVVKIPSPMALTSGGGLVRYTKIITNPGVVALANVRLTDDKCSPVQYVYGDANRDSKLDVSETWVFSCESVLTKTTTNTVIATGEANGMTARDIAIVTVVVASVVPGLPNTGFAPFSLGTVLIAGLLMCVILVALLPRMQSLVSRKR